MRIIFTLASLCFAFAHSLPALDQQVFLEVAPGSINTTTTIPLRIALDPRQPSFKMCTGSHIDNGFCAVNQPRMGICYTFGKGGSALRDGVRSLEIMNYGLLCMVYRTSDCDAYLADYHNEWAYVNFPSGGFDMREWAEQVGSIKCWADLNGVKGIWESGR
jgi:hypothetical protein